MMKSSRWYVTMLSMLGVLASAVPWTIAADQAARSPRAKIVTVEGAATTYQVEGMHGQTVTVDVPSQSAADVKLSNAAQGTVQGTVVMIDGEKNHVKVHTKEGQAIVLEMEPESLRGMRLGDSFTLTVPRPAGR